MHLHYHYPHFYLRLERNQDNGRRGGNIPALEQMVGLPMAPMVGIPLNPMTVIPQKQTEFIPQELSLKRREATGLVAPW